MAVLKGQNIYMVRAKLSNQRDTNTKSFRSHSQGQQLRAGIFARVTGPLIWRTLQYTGSEHGLCSQENMALFICCVISGRQVNISECSNLRDVTRSSVLSEVRYVKGLAQFQTHTGTYLGRGNWLIQTMRSIYNYKTPVRYQTILVFIYMMTFYHTKLSVRSRNYTWEITYDVMRKKKKDFLAKDLTGKIISVQYRCERSCMWQSWPKSGWSCEG